MNGYFVYNDGGTWKYNPTTYQPGSPAKVSYYAYAPATSPNAGGVTLLTGRPILAYTVPATINQQEDLLVATVAENASGTVAIDFAHALAQLTFSATGTKAGITFTISDISIVDMYSKGDINLYTGAWSNKTTKATYTGILAGPMTVTDLNTIVLTSAAQNSALFILPEAEDAPSDETHVYDSGNSAKVEDGKTYIAVTYTALDATGADVTPYSSHIAYIPVQASAFEKGNAYNVELQLGDALGVAITFTPSINNGWGSGTYVPVDPNAAP
jgi:hypothetical protein